MEKGRITLVPYGGLTNRMRAIGSVIRLMCDSGMNAEAIWFKDKGLNCRFDELFQPPSIPGLSVKEAGIADLLFRDRPRRKNLFVPLFFEKMAYDSCINEEETDRKMASGFDFREWVLSHRKPYLSACTIFYGNQSEGLFEPFRPIHPLLEKTNALTGLFSSNTVGVHIRRTDNLRCIKSSPSALYVEKMKAEIDRNADTRFYLATDSEKEKRLLLQLFGNHIVTQHNAVSRNTPTGMQDAVVELYALSKTKKIFGSKYSMYAVTAADIGGIELINLSIN